MLCNARFDTDTNNFIQLKGLFKGTGNRFKICLLYVNEGNSFVMYNNMNWELRSHVTCKEINVTNYLKCNICDHKETYNGKRVGNYLVGFRSRFNHMLVIAGQVLPLVNFPYTYITVP